MLGDSIIANSMKKKVMVLSKHVLNDCHNGEIGRRMSRFCGLGRKSKGVNEAQIWRGGQSPSISTGWLVAATLSAESTAEGLKGGAGTCQEPNCSLISTF